MIKRYNGTAWNAVTYCKNFNGTEQFTYFPVVANTFANAISSWTIKGNEQHTGTPAPGNPIRGVGEETANSFDYKTAYSNYIVSNGDVVATNVATALQQNSLADFIGQQITISVYGKQLESSFLRLTAVINGTSVNGNIVYASTPNYMVLTVTPETANDYWRISYGTAGTNTLNQFMINKGTVRNNYEPFGYKIPISSGNATTPVYISAPLRKSLDGTVFDTLDSTGLVTYNVDEYGVPLVTPATATVTVPTITSAPGRTVISFGTTIQPSEFDMTYHGWHSHIPSIRSNNAWS